MLTELIKIIKKEVGEITVSRGNRHTFLGMDLTFNEEKTVSISMKDYLTETIEEFPEPIKTSARTPAKLNLHYIDLKARRLDKGRSDKFHSLTMKLMFVCQRCRLDITTAISFLYTRVSRSIEQDWYKLKRVLEYLHGTLDDVLALGADSLDELLNFVDVSFAIHHDKRSHTGGGASFGQGIIMSQSKKQKINTSSTTESEAVGVSDYLPNTIWLMKFLKEQGYNLKHSIMCQDNQSAIKLEKNGRRSSSRRTRHLDVRFFNVKDKLERNDIEVVYCPTESMVADFFIKPLQARLFQKQKRIIMGTDPISILNLSKGDGPPRKERVGTKEEKEKRFMENHRRDVITYADVVRMRR